MCYLKRTAGAPTAKACVCSHAIPGRKPGPGPSPAPLPPAPAPAPVPHPPPPPAPPAQPLAQPAYRAARLGTVAPRGWMASQLGAQTMGLSGHKQIGGGVHAAAAAWVNGSGYDGFAEAWPYWLNGYIPLAASRNGTANGVLMTSAVGEMLDVVFALAEQRGGWLGPMVNGSNAAGTVHDPWSVYRFLTCLTQWWELTADPRVGPAMFRFAGLYQRFLDAHPLNMKPNGPAFAGGGKDSFSQIRTEEIVLAYQWLLDTHGEAASDRDLATVNTLLWTLDKEGFDWASWVASNASKPFVHGVAAAGCDAPGCDYFPTTTAEADIMASNGYRNQWMHGVNTAQGLSTWAAKFRATGQREWLDAGRKGWSKVYRFHGQASGVFSADEHVAGLEPQRGTETCTVVETLNSLMIMFMTSGDVSYADQAEQAALNALPAAFFNGSMWSLNYHQQVNKLDAVDASWGTKGDDTQWWSPQIPRAGTCTGSQPGAGCTYCFGAPYECCLSNHGQGWPKFAARALAYDTEGGLAIIHYFSMISKELLLSDGNRVELEIETQYPFEEEIRIAVVATHGFVMRVRVPAWVQAASTGASAVVACAGAPVRQLSKLRAGLQALKLEPGRCNVTLTLPMHVRVERRPAYRMSANVSVDTNAAVIYRGPLLYAMPRAYVADLGEPYGVDKEQARNHVLLGTGDWRWAVRINNDKNPEADLRYVPNDAAPKALPPGQGPFAPSLVPGGIRAMVQLLPDMLWKPVQPPPNASLSPSQRPAPAGVGRGAPFECINSNVSKVDGKDYTCIWTGHPPRSPVASVTSELVEVTLLPFGATDLRISEMPTTVSKYQ